MSGHGQVLRIRMLDAVCVCACTIINYDLHVFLCLCVHMYMYVLRVCVRMCVINIPFMSQSWTFSE